jgi:hypothetical protein
VAGEQPAAAATSMRLIFPASRILTIGESVGSLPILAAVSGAIGVTLDMIGSVHDES